MGESRGLVSSSIIIPTQIPGAMFYTDLAPLFAVKLGSCRVGIKGKMRIGNSMSATGGVHFLKSQSVISSSETPLMLVNVNDKKLQLQSNVLTFPFSLHFAGH